MRAAILWALGVLINKNRSFITERIVEDELEYRRAFQQQDLNYSARKSSSNVENPPKNHLRSWEQARVWPPK